MISKRVRRSSSPQENLKQFSLNNSKGIDGTKPITDPDTVLDMENLEINPDGSLSIRKPMLSANATYGIKEHLLYDGEHVAIVNADGLYICKRGTFAPKDVRVKCSTYYTYVEKTVLEWGSLSKDSFDFSKASFFNVSGATIVGNCFVKADFLITAGAIDATLYDGDVASKFLPRYIKLSTDGDAEVWDVTIANPELTQLTTAEGEIPLNPNMCLDNPYAIRDGYGYAVPSVKGIIPYVIRNGEIAIDPEMQFVPTSGKLQNSVPITSDSVGSDAYVSGFLKYGSNSDGKPWGRFLSFHPIPGALVTYSAAMESATQVKLWSEWSENFHGIMSYFKLQLICVNDSTGCPLADYDIITYTHGRYGSAFQDYIDVPFVPEGYHLHVWSYTYTFEADLAKFNESVANLKISQITESVSRDAAFKPFSELSQDTSTDMVFLKAFCNLPKASNTYYATWDYSVDGARWNPYGVHTMEMFPERVSVKVLNEEWKPASDVDVPSESDYVSRVYVPINVKTAEDKLVSDSGSRPDVMPLHTFKHSLDDVFDSGTVMFRFSIATLTKSSDTEDYKIAATVAQSQFTFTPGMKTTFLETDAPNAVLGEKLYYKKAIYSYGTSDYKSIVHVSDPGSFITPMYNAIDLDAYSEDIVTAVVPWRDYLLISTEKAVYLSSKTSTGFYTKLVSSSIGVDLKDRRSAVSALNGMVFKHGGSVYLAYPNLYASDDTMLMLTDISKPISHILGAVESSEPSFAIYYDDKYVLMLPDESSTRCLIYDTSEKRWSNFTYPVKFYDFFGYSENGLSTHTAVGSDFEYFIFDAPADQGLEITKGRYADVSGDTIIPIRFMLDTGQKTDSILHTKQFVETKLMFATLSDEDAFPLTLYVAIDGDPHVIGTDVSTDAPFWKTQDGESRGVLGTAFTFGGASNPATGIFNTLRQLIVRHSGKGKSIRYVLEGESLYNFKLYETYVRYKNLNIKQ